MFFVTLVNPLDGLSGEFETKTSLDFVYLTVLCAYGFIFIFTIFMKRRTELVQNIQKERKCKLNDY